MNVDCYGHYHYNHLLLGDYVVPVADCGLDHFSTHPKSEMKMADYLAYLAEQREQAERGDITKKLLYLKDWHLARYMAACPCLTQLHIKIMWWNFSCISSVLYC